MYFSKDHQKRHACHNCKEELIFEVKIGRRDMCPNCSAYLHACLNCEHHDSAVHNECRENRAEFIRDRSEGNFCLYFDFRVIPDGAGTPQDAARAKLDALFGAKSEKPKQAGLADFKFSPRSEEDARSALDNLFKK